MYPITLSKPNPIFASNKATLIKYQPNFALVSLLNNPALSCTVRKRQTDAKIRCQVSGITDNQLGITYRNTVRFNSFA